MLEAEGWLLRSCITDQCLLRCFFLLNIPSLGLNTRRHGSAWQLQVHFGALQGLGSLTGALTGLPQDIEGM